MSDNEPRERGEGYGAGRPDGEAPRTRFGGGAQGERPGGGDRPGGGRGPGGRGGPGGPGGPRWTASGWRWPLWRAAQGLRILCRQDRGGRLQGHPSPAPLHLRARQDRAAPQARHLRQAPALADHRDQASAARGAPALHYRIPVTVRIRERTISSAPGMTGIPIGSGAPPSGRWAGQPGAMPDREHGRHAATG